MKSGLDVFVSSMWVFFYVTKARKDDENGYALKKMSWPIH